MKVLFVCVANVGRSQMAEAFFNLLSEHHGESAGTMADEILARHAVPTNRLADCPPMGQMTLRCMREDEGLVPAGEDPADGGDVLRSRQGDHDSEA